MKVSTQKEGETKKYNFIEENHIDFVRADILKEMKGKKMSQDSISDREYESEIDRARKSLPVYALREKLLETIRDNQVVVLVGETGCGKTT